MYGVLAEVNKIGTPFPTLPTEVLADLHEERKETRPTRGVFLATIPHVESASFGREMPQSKRFESKVSANIRNHLEYRGKEYE